jgi:hypothetical protein
MSADVPAQPRSFRLTEADLDTLERLGRLLGRSQTEIVSMALVHLLATLERDERVHLTRIDPLSLLGDEPRPRADRPVRPRGAPPPEPTVTLVKADLPFNLEGGVRRSHAVEPSGDRTLCGVSAQPTSEPWDPNAADACHNCRRRLS